MPVGSAPRHSLWNADKISQRSTFSCAEARFRSCPASERQELEDNKRALHLLPLFQEARFHFHFSSAS